MIIQFSDCDLWYELFVDKLVSNTEGASVEIVLIDVCCCCEDLNNYDVDNPKIIGYRCVSFHAD